MPLFQIRWLDLGKLIGGMGNEMYLVIGLVFILSGIMLLVKPRLFFDITESWKHVSSSEPTNLYIFSTRFGGVIISIIGVACIIVFFCN